VVTVSTRKFFHPNCRSCCPLAYAAKYACIFRSTLVWRKSERETAWCRGQSLP
jgi:hypothetical protein